MRGQEAGNVGWKRLVAVESQRWRRSPECPRFARYAGEEVLGGGCGTPTHTSDPLVRADTPDTNVGRPSSGPEEHVLVGPGVMAATRHAVSAGMSTACDNRARLVGGGSCVWVALR